MQAHSSALRPWGMLFLQQKCHGNQEVAKKNVPNRYEEGATPFDAALCSA